MSCGVGRRHGSYPKLLWLWRRLAATAHSTPSLGTSICRGCSPKKTPPKKNKNSRVKGVGRWGEPLDTKSAVGNPISSGPWQASLPSQDCEANRVHLRQHLALSQVLARSLPPHWTLPRETAVSLFPQSYENCLWLQSEDYKNKTLAPPSPGRQQAKLITVKYLPYLDSELLFPY